MIYKVYIENVYRTNTYYCEYYSFDEYSITIYTLDEIEEENGNLIPLAPGKKCSTFRNEISYSTKNTIENISTYWRGMDIKIVSDLALNEEYAKIECAVSIYVINSHIHNYFYTESANAKSIISFYQQCKEQKKIEKESIPKMISEENYQIAENLISSYLEDELFDSRILLALNEYSSESIDKDWESKNLNSYAPSSSDKGKYKKVKEENLKQLRAKYLPFKDYFYNFAEMIVESNKVNSYVAYAIAWEAIRQKSIQIYASHWEDVYSIFLNESIEEIKERVTGYEKAKSEYIKAVLTCEDISIEEAKGYLIYFLASKEPIEILNMGVYFQECEKLIKDIQLGIKNNEIKNMLRTKQIKRKKKYTLDDIDLMSGTEFEEFVSTLFRQMGYNTKITQTTGDQGIDVIAVKNGVKLGIQAKCYTNTVGNSAVQEAVAGKGYYSCDKVMVITNNYFTSSAASLAQSNNVVLWDRDFLKMKLKEFFHNKKVSSNNSYIFAIFPKQITIGFTNRDKRPTPCELFYWVTLAFSQQIAHRAKYGETGRYSSLYQPLAISSSFIFPLVRRTLLTASRRISSRSSSVK